MFNIPQKDTIQMTVLPLKTKILNRFHNSLHIVRKDKKIFLYHAPEKGYYPIPVIYYDEICQLFHYNGISYSETEFSRVLDLLAFS